MIAKVLHFLLLLLAGAVPYTPSDLKESAFFSSSSEYHLTRSYLIVPETQVCNLIAV